MPKFYALVPLWPGSANMSYQEIYAENCDKAWEIAKTRYRGVTEIVRAKDCDMCKE